MSSESTTNAVNTVASSKEKQKSNARKVRKFTNLIGVISGYPLKLHDSNSMQNEKSTGLALYGPAHSRGNKPG